MVLSHDDFIQAIMTRVGDSTSDDDLAFIENMTDTITELENSANSDRIAQLEADNAELRRKYKERFMNAETNATDDTIEEVIEESYSYEDLWEEK